jgi:protoheme IX farnesyltransferase
VTSTAAVASRAGFADYFELTKPRITFMVVLTALVGFVMASPASPAWSALGAALGGTALVAAGASTLNMLLERRTDALMQRTSGRPLPSGRLRPVEVLSFGLLITASGLAILLRWSEPLAAIVAAVTWLSYVFAYTPLKTRTSLSTVVGAVPGALPPVIGWAAAGGGLDPGGFILFAILFLWQFPLFLAIAWIYRDDYARGGLAMLPVVDRDGTITGRQAVANSVALLLVSVLPTVAGLAGMFYLSGAIVLGIGFIVAAVRVALLRNLPAARALFLASISYLALLCALLVADRIPA